MRRFKVVLERMAVMIYTVEVDAETEEFAKQKAIDEDGMGDPYDYGLVDFDDGPPKAIDYEEIGKK